MKENDLEKFIEIEDGIKCIIENLNLVSIYMTQIKKERIKNYFDRNYFKPFISEKTKMFNVLIYINQNENDKRFIYLIVLHKEAQKIFAFKYCKEDEKGFVYDFLNFINRMKIDYYFKNGEKEDVPINKNY